jgi:hypothetical protein
LHAPHFSLAFIDGLHLFEQAYSDFVNLERFAGPGSVITLHDCLPLDRITSARTRTTDFYSGDVWKLARCLKEQRPDLRIVSIRTPPTGLCLVTRLDRNSGLLARNRDEYISRYQGLDFDDYSKETFRMPDTIANEFHAVRSWVDAGLPESGSASA